MSAEAIQSRDRLPRSTSTRTSIPRGAIDRRPRARGGDLRFGRGEQLRRARPRRRPVPMTISQEESRLTFNIRAPSGEQALSIVRSR